MNILTTVLLGHALAYHCTKKLCDTCNQVIAKKGSGRFLLFKGSDYQISLSRMKKEPSKSKEKSSNGSMSSISQAKALLRKL